MKTIYVIAIFVAAFIVVTVAISQVNPELTGKAVEMQKAEPSFFARLFGIGDNTELLETEVVEEVIESAEPEDLGVAEVSDECRAVIVENPELSGNDICSGIGKDCKWILAERTRTYYETELEGSDIDCSGKIQAEMKEYSLSAISCSGIAINLDTNSCSRMTTVASDEPRLGDVKVTAYQPFEVMCC